MTKDYNSQCSPESTAPGGSKATFGSCCKFTMFGDLFDEDFSFLSINQYGKPKLKLKDAEPPLPRENTNISGIRNQGGTCYLNSLLQTLLFTPEFREALFSIGPEELGSLEDSNKPDSKVRIIPLQLQRLFAQLLLLDQQAASTTDLTDSFGWNSDEEMRQHDVQELNRILFSALETSLVGTSGHNLINQLYHGIVVNQVICKECKNVSERQEDFLDLTVAVKGVSGLEEALCNMYVEEEHFEKDNLYRCGACSKLVEATKSAKLRKLPPFLTVSLLRFNFDFEKCERYKETRCYTFPVRINLKPFCEQTELDDFEYIYELFSVIIHKGGCYGGHYHVYIRDIDELGNWQVLESYLNDENEDLKDTENTQEKENPLPILKNILSEEGSTEIAVDQLAQKFLEKNGVSWNKKYRKQYGPIRKYLQTHSQVFLLTSDERKVKMNDQSHPQNDSVNMTSEKTSTAIMGHSSESHWFDLNDSKVQPIKEKEIEKQFQGNESAYMLFYRKSQMTRPSEARGNPRYRVPSHLLNEMDAANLRLQKRRAECNLVDNNIDLHLHIHSRYKLYNGALHPLLPQKESVLDLTIDKRQTLGDLQQLVFQLLEFWEGDLVLSLAKRLPAGLHIYQTLEGDSALSDIGLFDGADIFVWNGKEVDGVEVQTGIDHEPVLINVLHLAGHNEGRRGQQFIESQHVFSFSSNLRTVCETLTSPKGIILKNHSGSEKETEKWKVIPEEDMKKTLRNIGLTDGSSILVLDSHDQSMVNVAGGNLTSFTHDISWLQVKNFCRLEPEEVQVKITATIETMMADIRLKAIEEMQLEKELVNNTCLRPINRNGKLLCPVPEDYTVKEAELKMGSLLGLCFGKAPTATQLFLYFLVGHDLHSSPEMEIVVEENTSVKECLNLMLKKAGLAGNSWHLRKIEWCYDDGKALNEEDATLKELNICSGDTLNVAEGKLPPKGFLKIPVWWYNLFSQLVGRRNMQDQVNCISNNMGALGLSASGDSSTFIQSEVDRYYVGSIEISEEAFLEDLKIQVMTLPSFQEFSVPLPEFLRVWTMENKHLCKLLRNNKQQLHELKLGSRTEICIELLHKEENLGPKDLLLRVQMGIPGERDYYHPVDLIWDISKECTASALRQRIAAYYSLPVEKIEIAKYFPDKFEWMPISSWTQQVSKRKKKKSDSLQMGPYSLKDGDIVGVKNLLLDGSKDFSTVKDDIGKQMQKKLAEDKTRTKQTDCVQNDSFSGRKVTKHHRPEVALSISVGVFS
ncbi:ubiquitin carboxyl-terminal hydrolase 40 isoform X2 [Hemicordylus capensis]|uniref:ubiquitin carboxyl-terminal hydrolase 40 isoform X2 n=1 Tax=Hemicordylus capensis TaxID=884348 RepID=UPI00230459A3|nr:ubiquitin carboxyl-terminal hydrolase 40 isoform X2 [Hemicordylus capensis]